MEELLVAALQDLVEDVIQHHFGLLVAATEPKDVVFAHRYLELAMLCDDLQLTLQVFFSSS